MSVCPRTRHPAAMEMAVEELAVAQPMHQKFQDAPQIPKVHAEAAIAHFFWAGSRRFAGDDYVIGCSKPSCYCCSMYMGILYEGQKQRPSHGTAWLQWQPPPSHVNGAWVYSKSTIGVVRCMSAAIQADVQTCILSGALGGTQRHDSMTGTSSSSGQSTKILP